MTPYSIKILTPEKIFFEGTTEQIVVKTSSGNLGVLAKHSPYMADVVSSPLKIKIDGEFKIAAVSDGLIRVFEDGSVLIVTSAVEWADEIDVERAKKAKQLAEEKIKNQLSEQEFDRAERKLKRALNRLTVANIK